MEPLEPQVPTPVPEPYPPPDEGTPPEPAVIPEPYPPPGRGRPAGTGDRARARPAVDFLQAGRFQQEYG